MFSHILFLLFRLKAFWQHELTCLANFREHQHCGLPDSKLDAEFILSDSRIVPKEDIEMSGIQIIVP